MTSTIEPAALGVVDYTMPSLGADMDWATLIEWRVAVGQRVEAGDIMAVVDTEKSDLEIETFHAGTIVELLLEVGATAPVGAVIARYRPDAASAPLGERPRIDQPAPSPRPAETIPSTVSSAEPLGAATDGPARPGPVLASALVGLRPGVTPHRSGHSPATPESAPTPPADRSAALRRRIGLQMAKAAREIPHYLVSADIDLAVALDWMQRQNDEHPIEERLLAVSLLLSATAKAAATSPELNGWYRDDAFEPAPRVHLGTAVALRGGGLVAPAISDADRRSLTELMAALKDLVTRARAGRLRGDELSSPSLTVTNLGERGVRSVHPIINPPQVAMVGFGRIEERPVVSGGEIIAHPVVTATVAADHRISDGLVGAQFLNTVSDLLQRPEEL